LQAYIAICDLLVGIAQKMKKLLRVTQATKLFGAFLQPGRLQRVYGNHANCFKDNSDIISTT
jgi:hypothetical protein